MILNKRWQLTGVSSGVIEVIEYRNQYIQHIATLEHIEQKFLKYQRKTLQHVEQKFLKYQRKIADRRTIEIYINKKKTSLLRFPSRSTILLFIILFFMFVSIHLVEVAEFPEEHQKFLVEPDSFARVR